MSPMSHHTDASKAPVIGTAQCRGCGDRTDVYVTPFGARCKACKDAAPTHPECDDCVDSTPVTERCETCTAYDPVEKRTFTPSLATPEADERGAEMQANFDEFTDQLPDIGFDLELADGSVHEIDSFHSNAIVLHYDDEWREFLAAMTRKINEHYQKQTEPTKMVEYASWGQSTHEKSKEEYESQAELAPVVLYAHLRGAIMQMSLAGLTGEDEETPTVIGLSDEEIEIYSLDGTVTVTYDESSDAGFFDGGKSA